MSIAVSELATEIARGLEDYSQEVADIVKEAVDEVANEEVPKLKSTSPKRTGAYAKSWTKKTGYESERSKRKTAYNKEHYQITHLLEHGFYSQKAGRRIAPQEHIKQREEESKTLLEKKIRERTNG